ncbi:MAG: hypothetical protein WD048_12350 [Chitinophagales bacterium]
MKTILFTAALSAFSIFTFAQEPINVTVAHQSVTRDAQNSYTVDIPQANLKDVEKEWTKYLSKKSKGRASESNGEYIQNNAVDKNISNKPFDVQSKLFGTSDGVRLTAWFTQRNRPLQSSERGNGQQLAVQKYIRDFAVPQYREAVKAELETEQDKLEEMEKQLSEMIKNEEASLKAIAENERSNERAKESIATTKSDIKSSSKKIEDQKEMVEYTASDPNATKGAKKTLDNLEDDKKDLQKSNEKEAKDLVKSKTEIREAERNTSNMQDAQAVQRANIEVQKKKIQDIKIKLSKIA